MANPALRKSKNESFHIRISSDAKKLIENATFIAGQNITDFTTDSLLSSAANVLKREYTTTLSNRDRYKFLAMLEADDEPTEGLFEAAEIHNRLIVGDH